MAGGTSAVIRTEAPVIRDDLDESRLFFANRCSRLKALLARGSLFHY